MEFKEFYQKYRKMCESYKNCKGCPRDYKGCLDFGVELDELDELKNDVEQWSKEHPPKTRFEDLLEKYPSVKLSISGYPMLCCRTLGYCDECLYGCNGCKDCWNMPVEEDEK